MYNSKIKIFFKNEMALQSKNNNFSKSPMKPKLFIEYLIDNTPFNERFVVDKEWKPFEKEMFEIVHSPVYVNDFFNGKKPLCESNDLDWSLELVESVKHTNASLYIAIHNSLDNPTYITHSPTSGFHHATYESGGGFCTFSGQVLASLLLYKQKGVRGAYVDLDGHFGNSIESYRTRKDLGSFVNKAIPININPKGNSFDYLNDLRNKLNHLKTEILSKKIDYVVWCHGADSCTLDPLGHQCTPEQWLECTKIFIEFVKDVNKSRATALPITTALFGGYQKDFKKVLELHKQDIMLISDSLCR